MKRDYEALKEAAGAFREAIEHCKHGLAFSLMKRFPFGCCKTASLLLARFLVLELRYRPMSFISGGTGRDRQQNDSTHLWLEYFGVVIDITADQFPNMFEAVIVTDDRSWHDKTFPDQESFDFETQEKGFDKSYRAKFDADYSKICDALSYRHSGLLSGPPD